MISFFFRLGPNGPFPKISNFQVSLLSFKEKTNCIDQFTLLLEIN